MKITRYINKKCRQYFIDGRQVTHDKLNEICKKYLSEDGLRAMWCKLFDTGEFTIDFDVDIDGENLLDKKNAELQQKNLQIAALEKKLMQLRIKAAKYDCLVSAMKTA